MNVHRAGEAVMAELRVEHELERRWLGRLFLVASALALLQCVLPGFGGFDVPGLVALAAIALAAGVYLLRGDAPLPRPVLHGLLALGTVSIAASIVFTQGVPNDAVLLYLWVALYAFYFFPARAAWGHMAVVGGSFALAILLDPPPYAPEGHWATVTGAIAAAGVFVGRLKDELDRSLVRFAGLAHTDDLTGLPNRRAWSARAAMEANRASRSGQPLTVGLVDLDGFKGYNDRHGHAAGDRLLADAASAWRRSMRDFDFIARIGGDEFALLLPGSTAQEVAATAARLRAVMPGDARCSVGFAQVRRRESLEQTLARADAALYEDKGRDRAPGPRVTA